MMASSEVGIIAVEATVEVGASAVASELGACGIGGEIQGGEESCAVVKAQGGWHEDDGEDSGMEMRRQSGDVEKGRFQAMG